MFKNLTLIVELLKEQISLQRELIHILTGRSALTKQARGEKPTRQYTGADVFHQTRSELAASQHEKRQRDEASWRQAPTGDDPTTNDSPKPPSTMTSLKFDKPWTGPTAE